MNKITLAVTVMALSFVTSALAQERVGDAALGALSGAVVLGPVGAVAGAVIGYTAGPSIARSWGLSRSEPSHQGRPARRSPEAPAVRAVLPVPKPKLARKSPEPSLQPTGLPQAAFTPPPAPVARPQPDEKPRPHQEGGESNFAAELEAPDNGGGR
jgi:hypothetical protein